MEKETARNDDQIVLNQADRQAKLLDRWRKEVFDGLMRNKRYELLIKDNLARYNRDLKSVQVELKQAQNEVALAKNKISILESEANFKEEAYTKGQASLEKMIRQTDGLRQENTLLKQSLKGLTMQTEQIMTACLK